MLRDSAGSGPVQLGSGVAGVTAGPVQTSQSPPQVSFSPQSRLPTQGLVHPAGPVTVSLSRASWWPQKQA